MVLITTLPELQAQENNRGLSQSVSHLMYGLVQLLLLTCTSDMYQDEVTAFVEFLNEQIHDLPFIQTCERGCSSPRSAEVESDYECTGLHLS